MKFTALALTLAAVSGASGSVQAQGPGQAPPGAQQPPAAAGEVRGIVTDVEAKTPIARASVTVRNKVGTAVVAGALAGADGTFRIQGLRPGTYNLRVTYLGYGPKIQEFTIAPAAPQVNVGGIELSRVAVALQNVEVNSARPTISIEPDRNAYRAKDVAPAAANAADVLDATPSVQVDGDGKISLRGNENVAVQINSRPTPITGPQLAAYLKQIPASNVDRIEVVPNPSAKYDPEGMAGIINIVLKQNTDLGMSGGATAGGAASNRYNAGANLGYQSGPVTLFNAVGLNADNRDIGGINNQERFAALGIPSSFTNQDVAGVTSNSGQSFNNNVDYKLNSRDVLSSALVISHRTSGDDSQSAYSVLNNAGTLLDRYDRLKNTAGSGLLLDEDVSFKRTFEPRKHEISGEMRFNRSEDKENSALWRQPLGVGASANSI
ncbi:MAG: TonB-dependent receptor, partial [Gemmatimonadales bacterium]